MYKRTINRWENPNISGINRRASHASFYKTSSSITSLNGEWAFKYFDNPFLVNEKIIKENTNGYKKIKVPSVWQLQGFDKMWYTDVIYQFPVHPPFVPNNNPVGVYKRSFNVDSNNKVIIKFNGVDSAFDLYINDNYVGFSKVSRLPSEFNITDHIKRGKNRICVVVYKYSDGTYLEDQDEWWFSGIFRDVELIEEPLNSINDCIVSADLDNNYKDGFLNVNVKLSTPTTFSYSLRDNNNKEIVKGKKSPRNRKATISEKIIDCDKWTSETPNLYSLIVKTDEQTITVRFGFRKIEIINNRICVNGVPIILNGVNHHDFSPDKGRTISRKNIKDDILMMKRYNINAIRCSHYPSIDYLYDLCDEYGLYVIDETDLECDGCGYIENYYLLSNDPNFKNAYVDRCSRMVDRDINHPCIIMWSLGNESGFGSNFYAMRKAILKKDKSRLIHYEGDRECKVSDVYSTMYTWSDKLEEIAKQKGKPHILCEYCHSMGNGAGNIKLIQDMFRKYPRLCGGFIWEWYDHGIESRDINGNIYYKYGGDFNDFPNNGNFCIDGLLAPNRKPSTALKELKQVICPIEIKKSKNKDEYIIKNWFNFIDTKDYYIEYEFKCLNEIISSNKFDINIKANKETKITIPFTYDYPSNNHPVFINFMVKLKHDNKYEKQGFEIGRYQFLVREKRSNYIKTNNEYKINYYENNEKLFVRVGKLETEFNLIYGELSNVTIDKSKVIIGGPKMSVFRATIDNDTNYQKDWLNKYFLQLPSEQLESYEIKNNNDSLVIIMHKYFSCLSQSWGYYVDYEYKILADGSISVRVKGKDSQIGKLEPSFLPRLGITMKINNKYNKITYYGLGPFENYSDSKTCAYYDVFNTSVDEMFVDYVYPQENGHHQDLKWLVMSDANKSILFNMDSIVGFNVSNYNDMKLENAKHTIDLIKDNYITLHLDAFMSGLGSNSCGQDQLDEYKTKMKPFNIKMTIKAIDTSKIIDEVKCKRKTK